MPVRARRVTSRDAAARGTGPPITRRARRRLASPAAARRLDSNRAAYQPHAKFLGIRITYRYTQMLPRICIAFAIRKCLAVLQFQIQPSFS